MNTALKESTKGDTFKLTPFGGYTIKRIISIYKNNPPRELVDHRHLYTIFHVNIVADPISILIRVLYTNPSRLHEHPIDWEIHPCLVNLAKLTPDAFLENDNFSNLKTYVYKQLEPNNVIVSPPIDISMGSTGKSSYLLSVNSQTIGKVTDLLGVFAIQIDILSKQENTHQCRQKAVDLYFHFV
jgi:hypothetical protein